jgi:hypothetical protein
MHYRHVESSRLQLEYYTLESAQWAKSMGRSGDACSQWLVIMEQPFHIA